MIRLMGNDRSKTWFAIAIAILLIASEARAQIHFMSSLDRNVAAVGESFVLAVELLATPSSPAQGEAYRRSFSEISLDLSGDDFELVRSLRQRETISMVDPDTILHLTRKFVLKPLRTGRLEISPVKFRFDESDLEAGGHELMAFQIEAPFPAIKRAILPVLVETDIGDDGLRRFLGYGSSFLVADDALVTAYHVIVNARKIQVVLPNGRMLSLNKLWAVDPLRDIAVLYVDPEEIRKEGLVPLQIEPRDFQKSRRGFSGEPEIVFTAGWPQGVQRTQAGVLFAVNQFFDTDAIWLSSNFVRPGDSGGPLLNQKGQVIGVISYAMSGRQTNTQVLDNVATSTDPRPAVARWRLQKSPDKIGRYRGKKYFERHPHATAARVASLLAEFGTQGEQAVIGSVDPLLGQLDRAVTSRAQEARLHFLQGSVFQMLGDYTDATSAYKKALVRSADHFPAAYSLAYCHLALRSYENAAKLFDFITQFEPYENLALYGLAQAEMQMLDYDRAIEHLKSVIHDHPNFASGYYLLGRAYLGLGEDVLASQMIAKLQTRDMGWAELLRRSRTIAPFRPVRRFEMPAAKLKSVSGYTRAEVGN